jgi:hypothetical protein
MTEVAYKRRDGRRKAPEPIPPIENDPSAPRRRNTERFVEHLDKLRAMAR